MHACKEAWNECLKLKLPYYQISQNYAHGPFGVKHYLNYDVDTIWYIDGPRIWPEHLQVYCQSCDEDGAPPGFVKPPRELHSCSYRHTPHALAVSLSQWMDPVADRFGT